MHTLVVLSRVYPNRQEVQTKGLEQVSQLATAIKVEHSTHVKTGDSKYLELMQVEQTLAEVQSKQGLMQAGATLALFSKKPGRGSHKPLVALSTLLVEAAQEVQMIGLVQVVQVY